jgi:hypothetical protein
MVRPLRGGHSIAMSLLCTVLTSKISFQRIGPNYFTGTLAHVTRRHERPADFYTEFFLEFARAAASKSSPWSSSPFGADQAHVKKGRLDGRGEQQFRHRYDGTLECQHSWPPYCSIHDADFQGYGVYFDPFGGPFS